MRKVFVSMEAKSDNNIHINDSFLLGFLVNTRKAFNFKISIEQDRCLIYFEYDGSGDEFATQIEQHAKNLKFKKEKYYYIGKINGYIYKVDASEAEKGICSIIRYFK